MSQSITSRLNKWMNNDEHILVRCCKRCMSLLLALLGLTRHCIGPSVISILSLHWPWAPSLPNQWNPVQKCLAWGVCLLFAIARCLKFVPCALCNCVMGLVWTQDIQCMMQVILVTNALKTIDIVCTEHRQRRTKKRLHISHYISICSICKFYYIYSLSISLYIIVTIPVDIFLNNHEYDICIYHNIHTHIYIYIFWDDLFWSSGSEKSTQGTTGLEMSFRTRKKQTELLTNW